MSVSVSWNLSFTNEQQCANVTLTFLPQFTQLFSVRSLNISQFICFRVILQCELIDKTTTGEKGYWYPHQQLGNKLLV